MKNTLWDRKTIASALLSTILATGCAVAVSAARGHHPTRALTNDGGAPTRLIGACTGAISGTLAEGGR